MTLVCVCSVAQVDVTDAARTLQSDGKDVVEKYGNYRLVVLNKYIRWPP